MSEEKPEQPAKTSADRVHEYRMQYVRDKYRKHCQELDKAKHGNTERTEPDQSNQ